MSKCVKIFFYHLPFQRYWEFYSTPPCFTTAFLVDWVLATLTSCWEPGGRPTMKILARLVIFSSQAGSVYWKFLLRHLFFTINFQILVHQYAEELCLYRFSDFTLWNWRKKWIKLRARAEW